MTTELHLISPEDDLKKILEYFFHGFQNDFPIIDNSKVVGILTRNRILSSIHEKGLNIKIKDIMETNYTYITPGTLLNDIYPYFSKDKHEVILVIDDEKLLGIISLENISRYMMVHHELEHYKVALSCGFRDIFLIPYVSLNLLDF
ncbi:MAG: CBS domain-containing protein [Candidatus Firestonebacteria bacterium]|nr:CBS domain-containing protein [Candidatus Firestonebacteria bacterium]